MTSSTPTDSAADSSDSREKSSAAVIIREISARETVALRHEVLWPDHPISHVLLPEDNTGHHYGAFLPELSDPVAVISVFAEHVPNLEPSSALSGSPRDATAARFRKFACRSDLQGHGIGTLLLRHVMRIAREEVRVDTLWCDARLSTAGWYEKRGFVRFGPTFFKGEVEYIRMKAALLDVSVM